MANRSNRDMASRGSQPTGPAEWLRRARRNLRIAKSNLENGFADAAAPPGPLVRKLQAFRRRIGVGHRIQRMILFGSGARGDMHRFSDVDLIVVSPRFRRKDPIERAYPLHLEWDLELPVDFVCYTPEEFQALSKRGGLVREAL